MQKGKRAMVSLQVIEKKKEILMKLNDAMNRKGVTLRQLFKKIDNDESNEIEVDEFCNALLQMNVDADQQTLRQIFNSIDADGSSTVSWSEFKIDFSNCIKYSAQKLYQIE